jgi:hypothetical protein
MSFFEDLIKNATGLKAGLLNSAKSSGLLDVNQSTDETAMDVSYDPQQKFQDPYTTKDVKNPYFGNIKQAVPFTIDPKTGKRIVNGKEDKSNITVQGQAKLGINNEQAKKFLGMDFNQIAASWKDKGGFDGLMSNPAFQLGIAIMQSSAQGKSIGEDLFNNAVKAGAISAQYKDRLLAKEKVLAPITEDQRDEVKAVLAEDNYYDPDFLDKMKTGNQQAKYREALDDVYDKAMKIAKQETKGGKEVRFNRSHIRKAIKALSDEGKIKKRDPSFFGIRGGTIESTQGIQPRKQGGPVESGESYIVGEAGAEMFVPEVDGNIIKNDDTKVVNMLLESNPQLKNVSRARAVKILKARFPDYF